MAMAMAMTMGSIPSVDLRLQSRLTRPSSSSSSSSSVGLGLNSNLVTKKIVAVSNPSRVTSRIIRCSSSSSSVDSGSGGSGKSAWAIFESLLPSKEWAQNFSLLNYEDLCEYYEPLVLKEQIQPTTFVVNVMTEIKYTAKPEQTLEEINDLFDIVTGVPIIDKDFKCVGVLSKKDRGKSINGMKSRVSEVMSSPAITLSADKTVSDAAVLMLKNKIHRIPIVNASDQVIGIVTRTDIFTALEGCIAE